jgi:hypothetical protein
MNEQIKAGKGAFTAAFAAVLLGLLLFVAGAAGVAAAERPARQAGDVIWSDVAEASIAVQGQRLIIPQQYRTVAVTPESLQARLVQAPLADSPAARSTAAILSLPLPDGTVARFRVLESPVMAPELAARFPQMKTYGPRALMIRAWAAAWIGRRPVFTP